MVHEQFLQGKPREKPQKVCDRATESVENIGGNVVYLSFGYQVHESTHNKIYAAFPSSYAAKAFRLTKAFLVKKKRLPKLESRWQLLSGACLNFYFDLKNIPCLPVLFIRSPNSQSLL